MHMDLGQDPPNYIKVSSNMSVIWLPLVMLEVAEVRRSSLTANYQQGRHRALAATS
jgi:hypothetical protein